MNNITRFTCTCTLAFATLLLPGGARAQDYKYAAGWNAGGSYFTAMNAGAGSGSDITLDPGWIAGVQFESWTGSGRFGLRLNGALTERPLSLPGGDRSIGVWFADMDGLVRLLPAEPDRSFNLFVSVGAGLVQYRLGSGEQLAFVPANAAYDGDNSVRFAASGGLGADFITGWSWDAQPVGIRIEVVDHVAFSSPFSPLAQSGDFSPIHNARFVIGVFSGFGLLR